MPEEQNWNWTILGFVDGRGVNIVQEWYDRQAARVAAEFDATFNYLRVASISRWSRPYTASLVGKCQGFIEVRFKADNVRFRAIGRFGPSDRAFTILDITDKNNFDAKCTLVRSRWERLKQDPRRCANEPPCLS